MLLKLCFGPAHFCYCAFFLKLHPNCCSYAPSVMLFGGDFSFILYDNVEVINILCSIFILDLFLGWQVLVPLSICSHFMLCSRFLPFHSGTRGCICWVFSLAFFLLCSFLYILIVNCVHLSLPAVLLVLGATPGDLSHPPQSLDLLGVDI